jgi:DNA-binding response OmpR family regulator
MSEMKSKILIVDDDPDIRNVLKLLLRTDYETAEAENGEAAVEYMRANPDTDLIILDVMMPGMDGIETCEVIRGFSNVPILFLTAKSQERDRLAAYQSGGDDFLSKPFSQPELLAKVRSLLRRYQEYRGKPASSVWTSGNLEVDLNTRVVKNGGEPAPLTDTEYSILECLVKNRGRTVTTQELYETVWNEKFLPGSGNTIMVHVLNLRRKIEEVPSSPKIIRTVWGRGYQID